MALRAMDPGETIQFYPGTSDLPPGVLTQQQPGFDRQLTSVPTGTLPNQGPSGGDNFDQQIMNALQSGYPGRDASFYQQQLDYYRNKRATESDATHGDDYWTQRAMGMGAGGADVATAGPYAGQDFDRNGWNQPQGGGAFGGMPPGFSTTGANNLASFSAPGLASPWTQQFQAPPDFQAPSAQDVMNSPAVQARLGLGQDAIQRSAAAKGTLLTGGTLQDLSSFAQDLASQEYGNEWNRQFQANNNTYGRRFGEYGADRDTYWGNQNNAYNKLSGFAQLGLQGASQLGGFGSGYLNTSQNGANQMSNLQTGQGDANAASALTQQQNQNNTLGGLASNLGSMDWSKVLGRAPGRAIGG